jgi:hypothetical protein
MSTLNQNSNRIKNATPLRTTNDIIDTKSRSLQEKCDNQLPDYETLRNNNLKEINQYYNAILGKYKNNYSSYLSKINSPDNDERQNALTQLKPVVKSYNEHLIKINKEMIAKVNLTNDLLVKQKEEIDEKRRIVKSNYQKIDDLKDHNKMLRQENNSRSSNLHQSKELINNNIYYKYGVIGLNLLMLVIIIALLVYLFSV